PLRSTLFPYTTLFRSLNARKQPNEIYYATALGDQEGTRDFYVRSNEGSYYGSSFYEMRSDLGGLGALQPALLSKVPITRLDTLLDRKSTRLNSSHVSI